MLAYSPTNIRTVGGLDPIAKASHWGLTETPIPPYPISSFHTRGRTKCECVNQMPSMASSCRRFAVGPKRGVWWSMAPFCSIRPKFRSPAGLLQDRPQLGALWNLIGNCGGFSPSLQVKSTLWEVTWGFDGDERGDFCGSWICDGIFQGASHKAPTVRKGVRWIWWYRWWFRKWCIII